MDIIRIYNEIFNSNKKLLDTVLVHSYCVAKKAINCLKSHKIDADYEFVAEAAMLHDIGVVKCNAPDIFCYGIEPYICHGIEGRTLLESLGLNRHALVCERHTGSGLTVKDIISQNLPLPHRDMLPLTIEEKVICYADKFFSKSGELSLEKPIEKVINQMEKHGADSLNRFIALHQQFA